MCFLIYKALQSSGSKAGTHFLKPHLLHGCCRSGCLLLLPHNSFFSQHSLEMVRSMLVWDSLWKETGKYAKTWSACLCFAQAEEVPQQTQHSMNFQLCARKIVVDLCSEGAMTESYLSVWKEGVGRKPLVSLKNLEISWDKRGGVLDCFTSWHIHRFLFHDLC